VYVVANVIGEAASAWIDQVPLSFEAVVFPVFAGKA
jgi:hypothetical protein